MIILAMLRIPERNVDNSVLRILAIWELPACSRRRTAAYVALRVGFAHHYCLSCIMSFFAPPARLRFSPFPHRFKASQTTAGRTERIFG